MNTYHHYEFFDAETGKQIAEKFFTVQDTDTVIVNGKAYDLKPKSLMEQINDFADELSRNLRIPRNIIKSAPINELEQDD